LDEAIASGRELARAGDGAGSIAYFQALVAEHPGSPRAWYELACSFDREGREEAAVAPYKRALALGLAEPQLQGALLGLGSTLRNVGAPDEAVELLTGACERFPDRADLRVFLAFARQSAGDPGAALATLLNLILESPGIDLHGYERAIRYYTDELQGLIDQGSEG
jgi:Flp pilus assembly protein TadD